MMLTEPWKKKWPPPFAVKYERVNAPSEEKKREKKSNRQRKTLVASRPRPHLLAPIRLCSGPTAVERIIA